MKNPDIERFAAMLDEACVSIQKAKKKLRSLRNRGLATDAQVAGVDHALQIVRELIRRAGYSPTDIDSRKEREKPQ